MNSKLRSTIVMFVVAYVWEELQEIGLLLLVLGTLVLSMWVCSHWM